MRKTLLLALSSVVMPALAAGDGLMASPDALGGRWQARVEFDTAPVIGNWSGLPLGHETVVQATRLLGDYHLDALRLGTTGVRLTSGLLFSQRVTPAGNAEARSAWPYLGIGYAGTGARGDWGFSADLGLAAQNPGAATRLGRVFNGTLDLNDALRELRLQPVIRLGVNYSF